MSIKTLIETVESSKEFKEFKKEHKKAVLYSAFLLMRQAFGNLIVETQQLDYWLGGEEVAEFFLEEGNVKSKIDKLEPSNDKDRKFTELEPKVFDVEDAEKMIIKEIEKNSFEIKDVSKIICVLQKIQDKQVWKITCIIGITMLRFHISMDGKISDEKKGSLFDIISVEKGKGAKNKEKKEKKK